MNILLITDNMSNRPGANVEIIYKIANEWKQNGHHVFCLTRHDSYHPVSETRSRLFDNVWSFYVPEDEMLMNHTKQDKWTEYSRIRKTLFYISHPSLAGYILDKRLFDSHKISHAYTGQIEEVCSHHDLDAAICVTEPYYLAKALCKAKISVPKYTVMMDPYVNNHNRSSKTRSSREKTEKKVIADNRHLFALDFVYNDMDYLTDEEKSKITPFSIPSISHSFDDPEKRVQNPHDTISFVYAGQFYDNIRNPESMLYLFTKLPDNYVLDIYGGGCEPILHRYKDLLKDRLILHGWVSTDIISDALAKADVLVNLNNAISNMLPSKIIEYINTGKPILNICLINNCPSLNYMRKYPCGYNVLPGEISDDMIRDIIKFADASPGTYVDHALIEKEFYECLPENAAKTILAQLSGNT